MSESPSGPLAGKAALITGSASGIGLAIALKLAAAGAAIAVTSRDTARGQSAELRLRDSGARACFVPADLSREDAVRALIAASVAKLGGLDILVNNAGPSGEAFGLSPIHLLPTPTFVNTMEIGLYAPFWACKYALPRMISAGGGVILNISATAATRAIANMGAYAMAKAALEALTRQVANDYASHGVRCNSLAVGTVRPDSGDVSTLPAGFDHAALDEEIARTTMLGRVGAYADVAAAALFLVSPESRYTTGATIPVEGGALSKIRYPDYSAAFK
jgi:NAD(P)-dependent dehydrogenase (short-subunit alcohol dehydrogenase family)